MVESYHEHSNEAAGDPLALWLALELSRARVAFDKSRKEQDADFDAKGIPKTGVRVKLTHKSASEICVSLADKTIEKAIEFQSSPISFADARARVEAFTKEVTSTAIPLAYDVGGETGFGGSAVKAAAELGTQLCVDIGGAFELAVRSATENRVVRSDCEIARDRGAAEMLVTTVSIDPFLAEGTTKNAAIDKLFELWRRDAWRRYEAARDAVSDEFTLAGRAQSGYHIRGVSEAAERSVCMLLSNARALPIAPENYVFALANALALFAELANDVRAVAVGANGRMPTPANGIISDRLSHEGRARIEAEVSKWSLEDQARDADTSRSVGNSDQTDSLKVAKRRGRKPGSGSMAKADALLYPEMRALIDNHDAFTANGAATKLAHKARGNSTLESKATRLANGFRASEFNSLT